MGRSACEQARRDLVFAIQIPRTWSLAPTRPLFPFTPYGSNQESRCAANERPAFDAASIARLPVRVSRFNGEAGINGEVHRGLVCEAHFDHMVVAGGVELDEVDRFPSDLFKTMKAAIAIAADGGLAAPGDHRRG